MTVCALLSVGGSPGVTTAALAIGLTWPGSVIVAETDPSGGAVLAGLFAGHMSGSRSLLNVAHEATTIQAATAAVAGQLVALDETGARRVLPGFADPRHAATLDQTWHVLAAALAAQPVDVLADCGRLDGGPGQEHILRIARQVVLVLRPTLRQAAAARPRVEILTQIKGPVAGHLSLLVVGRGSIAPKELSRALGVPFLGTLPDDRKAALVLSDGFQARRGIESSPLLRAAAATARLLSRGGQPESGGPESRIAQAAGPGRA
jgi:hypothetical protein